MPPPVLIDAIDRVREQDARFRREAYLFLFASLGHAVDRMPAARRDDMERRHLTGAEVLAAMVDLARREFGPLAATVFREWGVTEGRHVGEMVFQLVDAEQLAARPEDRLEDFLGGPDLLDALAGSVSARRPAGH